MLSTELAEIVLFKNNPDGSGLLSCNGDRSSGGGFSVGDLKGAIEEEYGASGSPPPQPGDFWSITYGIDSILCNMDPTDGFDAKAPDSSNPGPQDTCNGTPTLGSSQPGSIIGCRDQSLSQVIPVSGTNLNLHYTTTNTAWSNSYDRSISVTIPYMSPYSDPSKWQLTNAVVTVSVAGQTLSHTTQASTIDPQLGSTYTFNWDGKDQNGTVVTGPVEAIVHTKYNFNALWNSSQTPYLENFQAIPLGSYDAKDKFKMGGWSLTNYHYLDSQTGTIYLGNGKRIKYGMPGASSTGYYDFPSEDGSYTYRFNSNDGRHLHTRGTITGTIYETFGYNSNNLLTSITDVDGLVTQILRNTNGEATAIVNSYGVTTNITIDIAGNLYEIEDPLGRETRFFYKNGASNGPMVSMRDPEGSYKYYTYSSQFDKLLSATDRNGGQKTLEKFTFNNPNDVTETSYFHSPMNRITKYDTVREFSGATKLVNTLPSGFETMQTTSSDGRNSEITSSDGANVNLSYTLNPLTLTGLMVKQKADQFSGGSTIDYNMSYTSTPSNRFATATWSQVYPNLGLSFSTVYNSAANTISYTSPLGYLNVDTLDSKQRVINSQFGNLNPIQYAYNSAGQLTSISQGTRSTSYAYDSYGNLASTTNPLNQVTSYTYDAAGQILTETLPNSKVYSLGYDLNGNLNSITNAGLKTYSYDFDNNENTTLNTEPQIGSNSFAWNWAYNADDQPTVTTKPDASLLTRSYNSDGTLASLSGSGLSRSYSWSSGILQGITTTGSSTLNFSGSPLPTQVSWSGAVTGTINYSWDSSKLSSVSVNNGTVYSYSYDANRDMTQVADLTFTRSSTTGFITGSSEGQVSTVETYNAYGESSGTSVTKNSAAVISLQYARDGLGRISSLTKTVAGVATPTAFTYDAVGQLSTETTSGVTKTYTYSDNGNRFTAGGLEVYDDHDRLVSDATWNYSYSANGNLARKDHVSNGSWITYAYDPLGNLLTVLYSSGTKVEYLVDGMDRRIRRKLNNAFSSAFIYQDGLKPIAQLNSNGTVKSIFVYGSKSNVPDLMIQGTTTYRIISNHLGSPLYVIKTSNSQIMQQITYDTWGKVLTDTSPGFQPFGFAGGLYDSATGLVRFGARDYDPSIGRWLNKDPIRHAGGMNLYAYVDNDPINYIDPDGLQAVIASPYVIGPLVLGAGAVCDSFREWFSKPKSGQNDPPFKGVPNSVEERKNPDGTPYKTRHYGPDGYPTKDIDYAHDRGHGIPHVHEWVPNPEKGRPDKSITRPPHPGEA